MNDAPTKLLRFEFQPDVTASSPLYVQLAQTLSSAIREGRYQTNEALPSERVLSDALGLSRVTARKAIDQLVELGLVVRRQGSGNYIAPKLEQPLSRLTSFSRRRRYSIRSAMVHIFSPCFAQNARRSGSRAIVPSSFRTSHSTPTSRNPASRHRSTVPSVCPARTSTPPGRATRPSM